MWYKNIIKNFKLFLIGFPIGYIAVVSSAFSDDSEDSTTSVDPSWEELRERIKMLFYLFIWLYALGIIFFALVFIFYTNILWFNKLLYHIKQYIKQKGIIIT